MNIPVTIIAFGMPGGPELIVILVVALLIFGRRLPGIMRSLGGSMREFKKGVNEGLDVEEESPVAGVAPRQELPPAPKTPEKTVDINDTDTPTSDDKQRSL